jgi:hypothetical protein
VERLIKRGTLFILTGLSPSFQSNVQLSSITPPGTEALLNAPAYERGRYTQAPEALHSAHETVPTLEAQVARREAELGGRDHQRITDVRPIAPKRSLVGAPHPNLPEVSLSEVVISLRIAEEHNHVLEQEVHELKNRVSCPSSPELLR